MRPGETAKAYQAFEVYRDMGPDRSLAKASQRLGKNTTTITQWATANGWVERVRAFDEAAAAKASERALESAVTVRARQAANAKAIQERAMLKLEMISADDMSTTEAIRAWQVGAENERKALGIPDTIDHTTGGQPIGTIPIREVIVNRPAPADE